MRLASIDIGSDSIHTLVAEVGEDLDIRVLDAEKEMAPLAKSVDKWGNLKKLELENGLKVLERAKTLCERRHAENILAVATSAVRETSGGVEFVRQARKNLGLPIRVLSHRDEARLIYLAVRESVHVENGAFLAIDIGGGSVKLIWGDRQEMRRWETVKLGTLRLANQFPLSNPPKRKEMDALREHIRGELDQAAPLNDLERGDAIATSGTALQLFRLALDENGGENSGPLHQKRFSAEALQAVFTDLYTTKKKERRSRGNLEEARVDTIIPGTVLFEELLNRFEIEEIAACSFALREGVLYDHVDRRREEIQAAQQLPDVRLRSVLQLARRCQWDEAHCRHVAALSLAIFDAVAPSLKWHKKERALLEYAAYLHDIGMIINASSHHRHTQYIIENSDLLGFTPQEARALGNVARYHRGAQPKKKHELYGSLSKKDRACVDRLSSVLRVAEGLDRLHHGAVRELRCALEEDRLLIEAVPNGDAVFETTVGQERAEALSKVLKRPVKIKLARG